MTPWLALAISLVAVAIALVIVRRMIDRRVGESVVLDEIRREIGAMLTEMNQTTERNIELVEDRLTALRDALSQADKRLGALKREFERGEAASLTYAELGRQAARISQGAPSSPEASDTDSRPAAQTPDETVVAEEEPPLRERVLRLYRQGISVERIASRVGTTIGEVELIVSLDER